MKRWHILIFLLFATPPTLATDTLRLCQDEIEEAPWRTRDNSGLNTIMLRMVESRLGLEFKVESLPWKRCLSMLESAEVDGVIAASYREEREKIGVYPATDTGKTPDRSRRMSGEAYFFYKLKDSDFSWDGNQLAGATKPVAAQMGYSAVGRLQEKGIRVDDRDRLPEQLLRKVTLGMVSAALLAPGEGDKWLTGPRFAGRIEKIPKPFYQTDGYLLLSRQYVEANRRTAERIWSTVAAVRTSAKYRKELKRLGQPVTD